MSTIMSETLKTSFSHRLRQICDSSAIVPEYGHGRQVFFANRLKVTQEAVRKWFTGEATPRPEKMRQLAMLLEVDEAWLALGIEPELSRREKRAYQGRTEGAIYMLFGMFAMAGGNCAFPTPTDPRAGYVDFYVILHGAQLSIHVAVARSLSDGVYEIIAPNEYKDVRCLGVIPLGGLRTHVIDLPTKLIDEHKQRKAGDYRLMLNRRGAEYLTGRDAWPKAADLHDLL